MPLGFRPGGSGSNAPLYSPERDLAYITPTLIVKAIERLDETNWSGEMKYFLDAQGYTFADLARVIAAYADAQRLHAEAQEAKTPGEALHLTGFLSQPYALRLLLMSALGEMLTGAYFMAIRDVTNVGREPPTHREMAEFAEAARTVAYHAKTFTPLDISVVRVELEDTKNALAIALAGQAAKEKELAELRDKAQREIVAANDRVQDTVLIFRSRTLWQCLVAWWYDGSFRRLAKQPARISPDE